PAHYDPRADQLDYLGRHDPFAIRDDQHRRAEPHAGGGAGGDAERDERVEDRLAEVLDVLLRHHHVVADPHRVVAELLGAHGGGANDPGRGQVAAVGNPDADVHYSSLLRLSYAMEYAAERVARIGSVDGTMPGVRLLGSTISRGRKSVGY